MTKITAEQLTEMVDLRERGWSCASIGKRLGLSTGAINYQCLKLGVTSPRQTGRSQAQSAQSFVGRDGRTFRRFTDDEDQLLRSLAAQTTKIDTIAREMGRARTSVRMRLLLLGQHEDLAA